MMKTACVLLADGFEEVEAISPIDYLRRAGVSVTVAGLEGRETTGSHGIHIEADLALAEVVLDKGGLGGEGIFDAVVVPGGGRGAARLAASAEVSALVRRHFAAGKLVAAICASPALVLHESCGILAGRRFTCYPGFEARVTGATFSEERVVVDGNLITSRAAGTAGEFAAAIVRYLEGEEAVVTLEGKVLLKG